MYVMKIVRNNFTSV